MTQDTNTEPKNKVMYSPEGLTQLILKRNLYGYVIGNYNYYSLMLYRKKVTSRSPTMYHRALRLKCLQVSFEPIESVSGRYICICFGDTYLLVLSNQTMMRVCKIRER